MKAGTWHRWFNKGTIALIPVSMSAIVLLPDTAVIAQVTPDRTLGSEQSTVNRNVTINGRNGDRIEGGARRGANLFHSFEQFNVSNGQRLYFANPAGVFNIIGRVTGRGASNISGTLGVQGNANLFLMNPNGIVFGNNATLDLRGSFVGTTANRLQFGTQGFFGTNDPQAPPLLTINPSALLFNQATPGKIQTQSVADAGESLAGNPLLGLRVADGQNLLLIGGDVTITGSLNALGGQLGLVAVKAPATVELSADSRPSLQRPVRQLSRSSRGNVLINGGAFLNVSADNGGEILINAEDIQIRGDSTLLAGIDQNSGSPDSQAGDVILDATGDIKVSGSRVLNFLEGTGTGGSLVIRGRSLVLNQAAGIGVTTSSQGDAGRVIIQVIGSVVLTEDSRIAHAIDNSFSSSTAIGTTRGILLEADSLTMTDGGALFGVSNGIGDLGNIVVQVRGDARFDGAVRSQTDQSSGIFNFVLSEAMGNAGDIRLSAGSLSLTNGAFLTTDTAAQGYKGGDIRIRVSDRFFLNNDSGVFSSVRASGVGNSGNIDIQAGSLTALNGAQLSSSSFGRGNAGDITIQVREQAIFDGTSTSLASGIFSSVGGATGPIAPAIGNGGNIRLSANQVELRNGAGLRAAVRSNGQGNSGSVTVVATDRLIIDGRRNRSTSGIFTRVEQGGVGNANDIQVKTDRLIVSNRGEIEASMSGDGEAGDIRIDSRILEVLSGGQLLTTTAGSRPAGDIDLWVDDRITLSGQTSGLFASTERNATGRGGSINITTHQLAVSDRAAITVSSLAGRAGNLTIAANQIRLNQGRLTAEAGVGSGAEITLQGLDSLLLQNNSLISAQASNNAIGGNVTVDAPNGFVVAVPEQNNDIIASADQGRGGNISITAQGIFSIGQQRSSPQNQTNDIDASSRFNQSGTVTINQPDIDPSQGLIELPTDVVDRSTQIARGCAPGTNESSRFVATGRGGLPLSPDQPLRDRAIVSPEWVSLDLERGDRPSLPPQATESQSQDEWGIQQVNSSKNALIEANEFSRDAKGNIILVAQAQTEQAVGEQIGDRVCLERSP
ncbi:MAG: S-layer family protein [Oscillatoriophycideae cyanobacterium NC_groundwater_1537_Pr4_S-0.65um_50_18]|nr:S-layer family protein [Oscillatoriophycideae cyanobacterium NC_groundwater_1537_Pr4_S-0.65um_50_18]